MAGSADRAAEAINRHFLLEHPLDVVERIEQMGPDEAAPALVDQPAEVLAPLWPRLAPNLAAALMAKLPDRLAKELLGALLPNEAVRVLMPLEDDERARYLGLLEPAIRDDLERLMDYPEDSAGRLMDTRFSVFRPAMTVGETLDALRRARSKTARSLFLIDEDNRLASRVTIQDVAVADPEQRLESLALPVVTTVNAMASGKEVAATLERFKLSDLPVVDVDGVLLGVVYHASLVQAMQEDATAGLQTMVGASRDERALSKPIFAVRKRMPWLQINLLTAFLAAAVVGLFEATIAQFTALAVLLPVVAGQSGNAGAQALAVTMRGLALREITVRQWLSVTVKELSVGFVNGLGIALSCGIGVYLWSGSLGLVAVIALSMVMAMVAAGFAGAVVPIMLTRLGQDPAQSSSIILTTVTDIAGFFSFLGIATLAAAWL